MFLNYMFCDVLIKYQGPMLELTFLNREQTTSSHDTCEVKVKDTWFRIYCHLENAYGHQNSNSQKKICRRDTLPSVGIRKGWT